MGYLFIAYLLIWVFLFGYILRLMQKTNRLLQEVESLKARLARKSEPNPASLPAQS